MASKAELLASARKKRDPNKIFRRGRGTNTNVRQVSADRNAGREAKAVSDFLGTMLKFAPGVMDAHNKETNEENKKLVAKGEATYKNATPDQRKQFRDNVRNGTISGGESPYFREGLRRSHADAEALEYGNSVMLAWESSEAKNSADPEAFNNFVDEFQHKAEGPPGMNRSWKERIDELGDHVANEEFWPKADAIKRQLSQRHSDHQRNEYNKKAQDIKNSSERVKYDNGALEDSMADSLEAVLLDEYVQDEHLSTHINVLKDSKNRLSKRGNLKSQFIANALGSGKNMKEARVAWNTKKHSLNVTVNNLSLETIGQAPENVFTIAAFKKEAKETQKDQSAYQVAMHKIKKKGGASNSFSELAVSGIDKSYKSGGGNNPPWHVESTKVVAFVSPVEEAETEELGLDEFPAHSPSLSHTQSSQIPMSFFQSKETAGEYATRTGEGSKGIVGTDQRAPSLSPSLAHEQSPQVALTQQEVDMEIAVAKGDPPAEDQVASVGIEASVVQPILPQKESVQTAMRNAIEGIVPERTSYGLVAYKTEDEAQRMVDNIRDGVVGDKTGDWDFVINKVGKVYQVQTQGGATMTDKHKSAFFDKLASEYPGEMGNLKAGTKDKDYVQIIPAKKGI